MCTRLFVLLALAAAIFQANVARAENIAYGVKVVVIDAGHGGSDPGAHYGGASEKDIVLKVALKLGKLIETEMPGVKVVYTRKTDRALAPTKKEDLQARADIANKAGGDLFVSIHANASRSKTARGTETLIMGETPKEQQYNESALFENNRDELIDMSDERTAAIVRAYIQNLQFTYGEYSMAMARCIQNSYAKAGRPSRGVKPQLLRVLYATDMPGVLTEIGFMSHPQEGAYLRSEKGQNEIARTLLAAVKDYSDYVLGTRLADEAGSDAAPAEQPAAEQTPPKPEPQKAGEGVVRYAVQVLASPERVPVRSARFKSYKGKVKQYTAQGAYRYKYCVGEYDDASAARKKLREVRRQFPDAFVVRCCDGRIVK